MGSSGQHKVLDGGTKAGPLLWAARPLPRTVRGAVQTVTALGGSVGASRLVGRTCAGTESLACWGRDQGRQGVSGWIFFPLILPAPPPALLRLGPRICLMLRKSVGDQAAQCGTRVSKTFKICLPTSCRLFSCPTSLACSAASLGTASYCNAVRETRIGHLHTCPDAQQPPALHASLECFFRAPAT